MITKPFSEQSQEDSMISNFINKFAHHSFPLPSSIKQ